MGEENKYLNIYFIYTVIASIVASVVSLLRRRSMLFLQCLFTTVEFDLANNENRCILALDGPTIEKR